MINLLPISEPPISSYSHHTAVLSILNADNKFLPWFCNHYIQLQVKSDLKNTADLDFYYPTISSSNVPLCPLLSYQHISYDTLLFTINNNIMNFIESCIDNDNYVYIVINTNYIPQYHFYDNSLHPLFIYGYDSTNKEIYCADFFKDGVFQYAKITYSQLEQSFTNANFQYWWNGLKLIRINKGIEYTLDVEVTKKSLEDYLYNNSNRYEIEINSHIGHKNKVVFGLENVYRRLISDMKILQGKYEGNFDTRAIPVFADHKKAMLLAINHLISSGHVNNLDISFIFNEIYRNALIIRNLLLKYYFNPEKVAISEIIFKLAKLTEIEKSAVNQLLKSLV